MAAETDDAFRQLNDAELAALTPLGVRRAVHRDLEDADRDIETFLIRFTDNVPESILRKKIEEELVLSALGSARLVRSLEISGR